MNGYFRDAIRLLFVLSEGSQLLIEPIGNATHIFRGEARLHALDFWMRYPDYLASELLDRFERSGRHGDLALSRSIVSSDEPDLRRLPMMRYFFGAFDPIDNAISILKSRGLVTITGGSRETASSRPTSWSIRRRSKFVKQRSEPHRCCNGIATGQRSYATSRDQTPEAPSRRVSIRDLNTPRPSAASSFRQLPTTSASALMPSRGRKIDHGAAP